VDGCRHDQGADHEGVEEHAEGDDEGDLGEDEQRQHGQGAEGGGQEQPGRGDHSTGDGQSAQDAPSARPASTLALQIYGSSTAAA
jgi:hypothetical protein